MLCIVLNDYQIILVTIKQVISIIIEDMLISLTQSTGNVLTEIQLIDCSRTQIIVIISTHNLCTYQVIMAHNTDA